MAFKGQSFTIQNLPSFKGGLNNQEEANEIQDNEIADCQNISIEEDSIRSAAGYVQWDDNVPSGSPADYTNYGPYWGIYSFRKSDNTGTTLRQRQGVLEYSTTLGGETWTECTLPLTGSPAATIVLDQKLATFATLNDTCIFANGQIVMSSTDGITWTNLSNLIEGGAVPDIVFNNGKNRLLYVIKDTSEIWWSEINDPDNVLVDSWQFIDPNNGQDIVGLALTPQGSLLCLKRASIYELDDITSGMIGVNFVGVARPVNHHAISTTEDSVIFGDFECLIREYIGGILRPIAGKINPGAGTNDAYRTDLMASCYYNGKYHLSMPNAEVSADYNGQEYIVYKRIPRNDPNQPYAITRNNRFFGCYGLEDSDFDYGRDYYPNVGDSRTDGNIFGWINDFYLADYAQGLNGEAQECYFTTKFFTANIPFYVKKFKKIFTNLKVEQDASFQVGYRFTPNGVWTESEYSLTTGDLDWVYDDASTGGFSEGYSFFWPTTGYIFSDVENTDNPRGIQFRIKWNQINDVIILGLAYQFKPKTKFK